MKSFFNISGDIFPPKLLDSVTMSHNYGNTQLTRTYDSKSVAVVTGVLFGRLASTVKSVIKMYKLVLLQFCFRSSMVM